MAKNAVDAHRKAERKKELQKNKQQRQKQREIQLVKKDTKAIEAEIRDLQAKGNKLTNADKEQIASLRAEVTRINKAKNEYVEKHPEHRKFVFPERAQDHGAGDAGQKDPPGLFTKDGKLKHPERSVYYDPVFNPFGVPPPGMPYRERPPTPAELAQFDPVEDEDSEDDGEDDDEDIPMPEGPPPAASDGDSDSESSDGLDDIPMPEGPPPLPPQPPTTGPHRVNISRPTSGPRPPQFPPPPRPPPHRPDPGMRHGGPGGQRPRNQLPPRPPPGAMQDPLSDAPHQTFQAHREARRAGGPFPPGASMSVPPSDHVAPPSSAAPPPPPPTVGPFAPVGSSAASATISAAPVLRDLKKEATAFVPTHMRRKQKASGTNPASGVTAASAANLGRIDATRGAGAVEFAEGDAFAGPRPSLMGALKDRGIAGAPAAAAAAAPVAAAVEKKRDKGKEDYEMFEREMAEFL